MSRFSIRIISLLLLCLTTVFPLLAADYTLGVLYFETSPGDSPGLPQSEKQSLAMALNEMMITDLSRLSSLTLVDRTRMNEVIEEQKLALVGLVDEDTAAEAGELLGARYLMTGSLVFTGNIVTFTTRITDTESGEIVSSVTRQGDIGSLFVLQQEVQEEIITIWDIPLSRREWKILEERREINLQVVINVGKAIEASDIGNFEQALTWLEEAVELNPDFELARNLKNQIEERFDRYIRSREEELPEELLEKIDLIAAGDAQASKEAQQMYMAFTMPLTTGLSFYGSWKSLDKTTGEYFFESTIRSSWGMMGLTKEPENMEEVAVVLGKKLYTAHRVLEYLLDKEIPFEGFDNYMHPVEGMTASFLTLFAAISSVEYEYPPMRNAAGEIMVASDKYNDLLLRYCDMLLTNFPYSVYATMVTPMMQAILTRG